MGLLDGGVAALFGEVFGEVFLPALVYGGSAAVTYDNKGTLRRNAPAARGCRIQVDSRTERWRAEPGFTAADVRVIILAASLEGTVEAGNIVEPLGGPYAGARFRLAAPIDRDPAGAGFTARGVQERTTGG